MLKGRTGLQSRAAASWGGRGVAARQAKKEQSPPTLTDFPVLCWPAPAPELLSILQIQRLRHGEATAHAQQLMLKCPQMWVPEPGLEARAL